MDYIVTNSLKNIALSIEWAECWLTFPKRIVNSFALKANVFSASGDINRCNQKHTTTIVNVCKCIFVLVHMCVWYALNLHMFTNTFIHAHYNVNVNPLLFPAMCALTTMQSIMIPSSFFYPSICLYALSPPPPMITQANTPLLHINNNKTMDTFDCNFVVSLK